VDAGPAEPGGSDEHCADTKHDAAASHGPKIGSPLALRPRVHGDAPRAIARGRMDDAISRR